MGKRCREGGSQGGGGRKKVPPPLSSRGDGIRSLGINIEILLMNMRRKKGRKDARLVGKTGG